LNDNPRLIAMPERIVPSLYEWLGGSAALNRLTVRFYEHVGTDSLLAPVFVHMGADHPGAAVDPNAPMPKWGWGEVKGPYTGNT